MRRNVIYSKEQDKHAGTGDIDHAVCVINGVLPMTPMGMNWQEREQGMFVKKCISFAFVEEKAAALATVPLEGARGNQDSLLLSSRH